MDLSSIIPLTVSIAVAVSLVASAVIGRRPFPEERAMRAFQELRKARGSLPGTTMLSRLCAGVQTAYVKTNEVSSAWPDGSYSAYVGLGSPGRFLTTERMIGVGINFMYVHMRLLQHQSPHLYFDFKPNSIKFGPDFYEKISSAGLVYYEGYISDRFDLYAPPGYALDALVIAAPDVLDTIDRHHMGGDIEILGDQLYMLFGKEFQFGDRLAELQRSATSIATAVDDNLSRYRDGRADHPESVAYSGRRLIQK